MSDLTVHLGNKAAIEARRRNAIASELLLRRLRKFHASMEVGPARYPLPSTLVGNPLVNDAAERWKQMALQRDERPLIAPHTIPTMDTIINTVCRYFKLEVKDLLGKRRVNEFVRPRQIAMYLADEMTLKSLPSIGRMLNRDHTTIIYGRDLVKRMIAADPAFEVQVLTIRKQIEVWTSLSPPAPEMILPTPARRQYDTPKWDDERSRTLVQMKSSGFSYGLIAQKLGVSKTACKARLDRMKASAHATS